MCQAEVYPQSRIYNHKLKTDVACEQRSESSKLKERMRDNMAMTKYESQNNQYILESTEW
jgi:hypothetical protein